MVCGGVTCFSGGESGTLHGQTYSVSGTVTAKAKSDSSYMLGLKYSGGSGPCTGKQITFPVSAAGDNGAGSFASADLTITNLVQLTGDTALVTGDYANFAFIA